MDLETTFATIADLLPDGISQTLSEATAYIPADLAKVIKHARSYIPADLDIVSVAQFMLYFAAASLILGVLGRIVLGKKSSLNHSLSAAMGILFVYALTIMIYTFRPLNLVQLLSPLPFVTFSEEYLIVLPISDTQLPALCTQILSLVILAFLVNLIDYFVPNGKSVLTWLVLRLFSVGLSMVVHFAVKLAFNTYLPETIVTYAPMILLLILVFMLCSGVINLIFGLIIAVTNPFLGAMYTFFFSNIVGKQLTKAVFSSAIVCGIFYLMEYFGYTVICITASALMTYIPLGLALLVLWYLIGDIL